MSNKAIGIIPARLDSERFPNKLLANIQGVTILERVINNVCDAQIMDKVIIATDSQKIVDFCDKLGKESFLMYNKVGCGSERVKHVYKTFPDYDWYVTFPADEPMILVQELKKMWNKHLLSPLEHYDTIRTCWSKFYTQERLLSSKSCKIVSLDNNVLYFSRAPIPYSKQGVLPIEEYKKHVGIFIFNNKLLSLDKDIWDGELAKKEGLEQISFLENRLKVDLIEIDHPYHGIDTQDDIKNIEERML